MATVFQDFQIRGFTLLDGHTLRLYCRLRRQRHTEFAEYRLYEDHRQRYWLEIVAGSFSHLEECPDEYFEQRVAADLLALGLNKYSG
ncbi:MAG: hypothetical protein ACUVRZ_05290 [Desulfobacca sp.]|uniref:hypothetical protein n=1 Tax=Desulfobacca sp. TaxID=2067990 RepID=UPI004049A7C0